MRQLIKRAAGVILALALVATPAWAANEAQFSDIEGKYGEQAILKLHALGVVTGYVDGNFHPADQVTRAQFAVMMTRALKLDNLAESMESANTFKDTVTGYDWAKGAINLAAARGWITGYPDGNFGPNDQISHEQMAAILVRSLGIELEATNPWYLSAVVAADSVGLTDDTFKPGTPATRGHVAQAIDRFLAVPVDSGDKHGGDGTPRITHQTHPTKDATNLRAVTVVTQAADPAAVPPVPEKTLSYDLSGVPVYGVLAEKAQLQVFYHGGKPFMAQVVDLVKSLEFVSYAGGGTHIVVKEKGAEQTYELAGTLPSLVAGGQYLFTFDAEGKVVRAEVDSKAVAGEIVEGKSVVGGTTYRVVLGGKTYTFDRSAYDVIDPATTYWLKRSVTIDGITYPPAQFLTDEGWKAMAEGDRLVVKAWHGAQIQQADVTAGSIADVTVTEALTNQQISFDIGLYTYVLDLRIYPGLRLTRGSEVADLASLKVGEKVTLKIDPVTTKLVGVEGAPSTGLEGQLITEAWHESPDGVKTIYYIKAGGKQYEVTGGLVPAAASDPIADLDHLLTLAGVVQIKEATISGGKITALTYFTQEHQISPGFKKVVDISTGVSRPALTGITSPVMPVYPVSETTKFLYRPHGSPNAHESRTFAELPASGTLDLIVLYVDLDGVALSVRFN